MLSNGVLECGPRSRVCILCSNFCLLLYLLHFHPAFNIENYLIDFESSQI